MALIPRLRPRPVLLDKDQTVAKAVEVAQRPQLLDELPRGAREQVEEVVKAIQVGSGWVAKRVPPALAKPDRPVSAAVVAARAKQLLSPSSSITPVDIAQALQTQGLDWVEPFAPGTPLTPFYGYGRRPRNYDYTIGRNVTTDTRPNRIPFETLKQLFDSYDVARTCVVPGTLVVAKRGIVPIETIRAGEEVLTHLGRWRRVREAMVNPVGARRVFAVSSGGLDPLVATGEHPMLVARYTHTQRRRRVMREMAFVDIADTEPRGEQRNARWHYDAAVLPSLSPDAAEFLDVLPWLGDGFEAVDGQVVKTGPGSGRFVSIPARLRYSDELGRVLGWYLAEGSRSHGRSVGFVLGPDEEHFAQQILADIESVFGIKGRYAPSHVAKGFELTVSNSAMARLFDCGLARTKRIPEWAWAGGPQFLRAVLDSWALGDGCTSTREGWAQRTTVVTASYTLAWQMRLVAVSLGLKPSIKRRRGGRVSVIRGGECRSGEGFQLEWAEKPQATGRYSFECDGRYLATAIRTVEPVAYEGVVHNLSVEEDESYVTTGGTVHNCTRHSINDLRSMRVRFEAADGYEANPTKEIAEAKRRLRYPDGVHTLRNFLAQNMLDLWRYDSAPIYRMRDKAGNVTKLVNIEAPTIAPMLDYYGDFPKSPAPAFQQFIQGVPWDWLTWDDIIYQPFWPETESPYGTPPLETVLINANTDVRLQLYFLQFFCYDDQTEVLTRDGWRRFSDLDGSEEYATRSPSGKFEWQHTVDGQVHRFAYDGDLVQFSNQCVDQLVTPNHRMLVRHSAAYAARRQSRQGSHHWHIRRADFFVENPAAEFQLPILSEWDGIDPGPVVTLTASAAGPRGRAADVTLTSWAWARFLGLFVAEGYCRKDRYDVVVSQFPNGDLDEVRRILKDTGLSWLRRESAGSFTCSSKALWTALQACGHGAPNKRLPAEVLDWPPELLREVLHGLQVGDGHTTPSGQRVYTTTSPVLADQVQELWQKVGVYASVNRYEPDPRTFAKLPQYRVRTRPEDAFRVPRPTLVPYQGTVSCVSVPNGVILVRRNGKALWCGNTAGAVPEALAIAPEDMSSPDDIADFQEQYSAFFDGDQAERWGLKWLPHGTELQFYKPQTFDPDLAEYVERRTVAAFGLTPQDLGILSDVNRACYSDDTETLTENGWKRYDAVAPGEKIATFNPATKALEFHVPEKLYTYPYEGEMVRFSSRQVDCLVTPDHKMWVGNRSKELPRGCSCSVRPTWEKVAAQDLERRGSFWFADSVVWEQGEEVDRFTLPGVAPAPGANRLYVREDRTVSMDVWLEFLGYVVSEGCIFGDGADGRYRVALSQNVRANPEKVRTIDACIAQLPFAFRSYDDQGQTRRWQVSDKALWTWLRKNVGRYSEDKKLPDLWRSLGKRQLSILFEALMLGDGTGDPSPTATNRTYFTKSKVLADQVQELALRLGFRAQVTPHMIGRVYRVGLSEPHPIGYELRPSRNLAREHYRGTVWCFHVPPNHLFLTRRNGKVTVAGNTSDTQMDTQFRISTLPIVGYYEDILDSVIQDDWGLPVQLRFDTGREKEDRLMEAQAHQIYVQMGAESPDDVAEKVLGHPINPEERIPRFIMDPRLGIIPLAHVLAISGEVDPRTGAPVPGTVHPQPFELPGQGPIPAAGPQAQNAQPGGGPPKGIGQRAVSGPSPRLPGAAKSGATPDEQPDEPGLESPYPDPDDAVGYGFADIGSTAQGTGVKEAALELRRWRSNARKAVARGKAPRRFVSDHIPAPLAEQVWKALEGAATREQVDAAFKGRGPAAAGIVVQALDTGRVLMVQRQPDKHDPGEAYARWEFAGGKVEDGETPWDAALREWSEETGATLSDFTHVGNWTSPDGVYQGFVVTVPQQSGLRLAPQAEEVSRARWWHKDDLADPTVRDKVTDTLDRVVPMLKGWGDQPRGRGGRWRTSEQARLERFHRHTDRIVAHHVAPVGAAMAQVLDRATLDKALHVATQVHKATPKVSGRGTGLPPNQAAALSTAGVAGGAAAAGAAAAAVAGAGVAGAAAAGQAVGAAGVLAAALAVLAGARRHLGALRSALDGVYGDGALQGAHEAASEAGSEMPPWTASVPLPPDYFEQWQPGVGREASSGAGGSLAEVLRQRDMWIKEITDTEVDRIGEVIGRLVDGTVDRGQAEREINAIVHDEARAELIADTEYLRAYAAAQMETYQLAGVAMVEWLTEPGACHLCVENRMASPQPASHPAWPNGGLPVHPHERCSIAPAVLRRSS